MSTTKYFFTADTHFLHHNIIKYCKRPYANVDEMNEDLIARWNAKVGPNDTVMHLGDVSLGHVGPTKAILSRLNGKICLIKGNHDDTALACHSRFEWIKDVYELYIPDKKQKIFLSHYAHRVWNKSHRGVWHLYGHSHGTLPDDPESNSFDCGVDCHGYAPLSFEEVKAIMDKKKPKAKDHHGA